MSEKRYPEEHEGVVETWSRDGMTFTVLRHSSFGHFCGYVRLPRRPVGEEGYRGILTYAPVHGGITFAEDEGSDGMVYGFDCGHSGDDMNPDCQDLEWAKAECYRMACGILVAARYERAFLTRETEKDKANVLARYHRALKKEGIRFDLRDNFGAMIGVLCGHL
jgi:hypothetical protein